MKSNPGAGLLGSLFKKKAANENKEPDKVIAVKAAVKN